MGNILEVAALTVSYVTAGRSVRALDEVELSIGAGEAVGLVGESGSGKSTLARVVLGLTPRGTTRLERGAIRILGRDVTNLSEQEWSSRRGNPIAIVFQDPLSYLNPVMRVGTQIAESVRRHAPGIAVQPRVAELLELVKLPARCARDYPHQLSGGMRQRVLLAIALGCRPQLLIADEPTTALDVTTQGEILRLLSELRHRLQMALLLISHDLGVVAAACERICVMYGGRLVECGPRAAVFAMPAHPYTVGLLHAARAQRDAAGRFVSIAGDPPDLFAPPTGCPFAPRCGHAMAACADAMPPLYELGAGHGVRCWRYAGRGGER